MVVDSKQNNVSLNVLPRDYFSLNRMVTLCYRKIMQMEDYIMIGCLNLYPYQRKYSLYVWSGDTWHWAQHMSDRKTLHTISITSHNVSFVCLAFLWLETYRNMS